MQDKGYLTEIQLDILKTMPADKQLSEITGRFGFDSIASTADLDFREYDVGSVDSLKCFAWLVTNLWLQPSKDNESMQPQCWFRGTYITGGIFPIDTGLRRMSFADLSREQVKVFLLTGSLPSNALNDTLERIGIGKKYHTVDPDRFRQKDFLRRYMTSLANGDRRGFILLGNRGVGKTSVMSYLVRLLLTHKRLLTDESDIAFFNSDRLFAALNASYLRADQTATDKLRTCRYVIIDDLGQVFDRRTFGTVFEGIMSHRYDHLLSTFLTTNMSAMVMREHAYFGRLADRCNDPEWMHAPLIIAGESLRKAELLKD